ncbi:MAG: 16S rRNA (guanine(527)-N(7))-methyltransferase RsmG [Actinomycetota bacterium]
MSSGVEERLQGYEELLRSWASRLDLVAGSDLPRLRERHIDDSLRLLPLLEELPPGPCVDVGAGAGLPGIPLAIAAPDRRWVLLEPRQKRAGFLEEVVRALDLNCEVLVQRAEEAAGDPRLRGRAALVTARALAPPDQAITMCLPLACPGGAVAIFKGRDAALPSGAEEWSDGIAIVRVRSTSP